MHVCLPVDDMMFRWRCGAATRNVCVMNSVELFQTNSGRILLSHARFQFVPKGNLHTEMQGADVNMGHNLPAGPLRCSTRSANTSSYLQVPKTQIRSADQRSKFRLLILAYIAYLYCQIFYTRCFFNV